MKQNLNYSWKYINSFNESFLSSFPSDAVVVDIPHTNQILNDNYIDEKSYQFVSTYEKIFDVKEKLFEKCSILHFEGFMLQADIYLNGVFLGHFISGYLPVDIDVSECIKEKGNRLVIKLDAREDKNIPPFGYVVDYLTYGGIYREVTLIVKPKIYIKDVFIKASMNKEIDVAVELNKPVEHTTNFELFSRGNLISKFAKTPTIINEVTLWSDIDPKLYQLRITVETSDGLKDQIVKNVGFRTIGFDKNHAFTLNGKTIKLRGLNRHQSFPYVGYAMPKSMQELDAIYLKAKLGCNVVRTSHYLQSEHFLNMCDRIGLLVIDEVPGWQHIGTSEKWKENFFDFIRRMILKERNHPSLIFYGVRIDESNDDHLLYDRANKIAHEMDNSRPTIGVRNFKNSELLEDIYGYNDFVCDDFRHRGLDNPNKILKDKSPYLVTEHNGHMFPTKSFDKESIRIEQALRHARVLNDSYKYKRCSGVIGWCFVDYYTHASFGSGDHVCYHGVLDMFRSPKYASFVYESQSDNHDVLQILSNFKPGDYNSALLGKTYVFTNADYIELYKNNEFIKSFYPLTREYSLLPHPPIIVDDYIGKTFKELRFKDKDAYKIKEALRESSLVGFNHLKLKTLLTVGIMMKKYHLQYSDIVTLWNRYVGAWGGESCVLTFKSFKNDVLVQEKKIGPSIKFHLISIPSTTELVNGDTYDVLCVLLRYVDEYDTVMPYASKVVSIETEGPISLIGPTHQALKGGMLTVYIRSQKVETLSKAKIKIRCDQDERILEVTVK